MMERFIFKGSFCKCVTHFSPPVKKQNSREYFIVRIHREKRESFVKGKEQRKEDPLQD